MSHFAPITWKVIENENSLLGHLTTFSNVFFSSFLFSSFWFLLFFIFSLLLGLLNTFHLLYVLSI
jgi:hypothetical protein